MPEQVNNLNDGQTDGQKVHPFVDESKMVVAYANFCRVLGTPEELIIDFGLNPQPTGMPESIDVSQRLVLNFYTAKRLLHALSLTIQRHEAAFGVVEVDVHRRIQQQQQQQQRQQ